jgi:hypothetical protein
MNFDTWLSTATQNLPNHRLETIRQELTTHYLDAVDDYLLQGLSSDHAKRVALRELGDARAVCDGLRSVHIHRRDYWRAMVIACLPTVCVIVFLPLISQFNRNNEPLIAFAYSLFVTITAVISVWATIHSIKMVSMIAYMGDEADLPLSLMSMGFWVLLPLTIFSTWSNKLVFIAIINTPTLAYSQSVSFGHPLVIIISAIASFGLLLVGIGWVIFATKITSTPTIATILPFLRGLIFVMGMGITTLSVGAILRDNRLTVISTTISLIFGILTFALFIIVFYQMGRNTTPSRPLLA